MELAIDTEARNRMLAAKTQAQIDAAQEWEREAKRAAGLDYRPAAQPLTAAEISRLPDDVVSTGLKHGFLRRAHDGRIVDSAHA